MPNTTSPKIISVGSIFIDDIVYPDGRTRMGVLGGGAVHAAAAMALWDEKPGLAARVGKGLPEGTLEHLATFCDLDGLTPLDLPQVRAWQVFEHDGTRRELLRVDVVAPFRDGPPPNFLPQPWLRGAQALYMVIDGPNFSRWAGTMPHIPILWEPNQPYMITNNAQEFQRIAGRARVVSPNITEARQIYGNLSPEALISAMLRDHIDVAVVRAGRHGSFVGASFMRGVVQIPAIPVDEIDITGAGNAYNGAFLVGFLATGDPILAARWGTVAASLCIESIGVLDPNQPNIRDKRDERLKWLETRGAGSL
jgi:sugar/nucleoside kinase (ribokinase family)